MQIEVRENFEIKNLTTFKVGGAVNKLYLPQTQQELVYLLKTLEDYILLGNCSNILFSSEGYDGNVILTTGLKNFEINGNFIKAECGVKGPLLSQKAAEAGLSGFEFMIGFPGTIGGEVFMNASAHGQSVSDTLLRCCVFDKTNKEIIYKEKKEMDFNYRKSILQDGRYVLLEAEFKLEKGSKAEINALMERNLSSRKDIQPNLAHPNAGSVFKNPTNDSAGRLLEKAGGKLLNNQNAQVWQKHANFIVNTGDASSEDILDLMLKMYDAVKEKFTIELTPEIIFVGKKNKKEEEICKILYQKTQK